MFLFRQTSHVRITNMEDFEKALELVEKWILDYWENSDRYPVLANVQPGEIAAKLPNKPPLHAESFESAMSDFQNILMPGVTHWNHPKFYAYFANTASPPGILGEM